MTSSKESIKGFLPKGAILMARRKGPGKEPGEKSAKKSTEPAAPKKAAAASSTKPDSKADSKDTISGIAESLEGCKLCKLCKGRTNIVPGEGNPKAELVFVGEAPGEQEDLQGRPFIGRAGQLLEKMIEAMGLKRDQVFICNVVKCRPPGNRNPEPDEIAACSPFLHRQLDTIRPKVVVALGKFAAQTLLQTETPISKLRGQFHEFRGAKLMPTFHPAYLLRNPPSKREAWEDLKTVAKELGLKPTGAG